MKTLKTAAIFVIAVAGLFCLAISAQAGEIGVWAPMTIGECQPEKLAAPAAEFVEKFGDAPGAISLGVVSGGRETSLWDRGDKPGKEGGDRCRAIEGARALKRAGFKGEILAWTGTGEAGRHGTHFLPYYLDSAGEPVVDPEVAALLERMDAFEEDLEELKGRMDSAEGRMDAVEGENQRQDRKIEELESRPSSFLAYGEYWGAFAEKYFGHGLLGLRWSGNLLYANAAVGYGSQGEADVLVQGGLGLQHKFTKLFGVWVEAQGFGSFVDIGPTGEYEGLLVGGHGRLGPSIGRTFPRWGWLVEGGGGVTFAKAFNAEVNGIKKDQMETVGSVVLRAGVTF